MKLSFADVVAPWFRKHTVAGRLRNKSASADFLHGVGIADTIEFCRFIDKIGKESFIDYVAVLSSPNSGGRPQTDFYTPWLDLYDEKMAQTPDGGPYEIATLVAYQAFQEPPQLGRPASVATMADTIVNRIRSRDSARPRKIATDKELRARISRRVDELVKLTQRWNDLDHLVKVAAKGSDHGDVGAI